MSLIVSEVLHILTGPVRVRVITCHSDTRGGRSVICYLENCSFMVTFSGCAEMSSNGYGYFSMVAGGE